MPDVAAAALAFREWEQLLVRIRPPGPLCLRCHPSVHSALSAFSASPEWEPYEGTPMFGVAINTDPEMPFGAWEMREGDQVIREGVLGVAIREPAPGL